jgi:hypothetical protein
MPTTPEKSKPPVDAAKRESNFARSVTVLSLACTVIALLLLGMMALKIYEPWGILSKSSQGGMDTTPLRLRQIEALHKLQEIRITLLEARIAYLETKDPAKVIRQLNAGIAALDNLGKISTSGQKIRADKLRIDFKTAIREIEKEPRNTPEHLAALSQGWEDLQDYYSSVVMPEK